MHYIADHPEVAIFVISSAVAISGAIIRLFWRVRKHDEEITAIKNKHAEDMKSVADNHKEDMSRIYIEIDDVKQSYMTSTNQVLSKLDELAKDVKSLAVDIAFFKGQQARDCK